MNLTISGHHLEVTPALREYVLTKLDRVTRHFDQVVDVTVLLTVEKLKEKERRQKGRGDAACQGPRHLRRTVPRGSLCGHRPADGQAGPASHAPQGPPAGSPPRVTQASGCQRGLKSSPPARKRPYGAVSHAGNRCCCGAAQIHKPCGFSVMDRVPRPSGVAMMVRFRNSFDRVARPWALRRGMLR